MAAFTTVKLDDLKKPGTTNLRDLEGLRACYWHMVALASDYIHVMYRGGSPAYSLSNLSLFYCPRTPDQTQAFIQSATLNENITLRWNQKLRTKRTWGTAWAHRRLIHIANIPKPLPPQYVSRILAHELGHIVFDHRLSDAGRVYRSNWQEFEAEMFSYLLNLVAGHSYATESRNYLAWRRHYRTVNSLVNQAHTSEQRILNEVARISGYKTDTINRLVGVK